MKAILLIILGLFLTSCGIKNDGPGKLKFFEVTQEHFNPYINEKAAPEKPDLNLDKVIVNDEYPFEIALYKDKKWFYHLKNLGDGFGSWKFENGRIILYAERIIFDMYVEVVALSEEAKDIAIRFADRKGPRELLMKKINIE